MSNGKAVNDPRLERLHARRENYSHDYSRAYSSNTNDNVETPIDSTFGQQMVFPIPQTDDFGEDDELSRQAVRYLQDVSSQAKNEATIFFVDRKLPEVDDASEVSEMDQQESEDNAVRSTVSSKDSMENIESGNIDSEWRESSVSILNNDHYNEWSQGLLQQFLVLKERLRGYRESMSESNSFTIETPQTASEWRKKVMESAPPNIDFFFQSIDHPTVIKLIIYFTKWLSLSANDNFSQWIWFVFLRLDKLMSFEEQSSVRNLGKKALKLSKKFGESQDVLAVSKYTIHMTLSIVTDYYGQKDLKDYKAL